MLSDRTFTASSMSSGMKYLLIVVTFLLLTDTCGKEYHRRIENNTPYGVKIINYDDLTLIGADTLQYIKPYGLFKRAEIDFPNLGIFKVNPPPPDQVDSVVIFFYQEGTDTVYRKRFLQYDTTLLFRCLTGSEPTTCFIEERHLEGATLIVK